MREYGGLAKISSFVQSSSSDVKMQALNVLNNLAMDIENQRYLKVCDCLYYLSNVMKFFSTSAANYGLNG